MSNKGNHFRGNRRNHQNQRRNYGGGASEKKQENNVVADESNPVIASFRQYAQELDEKHDRHERIVKHSRDITIESKRIIFLLHTVDNRKPDNEKILKDAMERLMALCNQHFAHIAKELHGIDPYQYTRAYTAGLQEFIEAYTYYEYIQGTKISDWDDLQQKLAYDKLPEQRNGDDAKSAQQHDENNDSDGAAINKIDDTAKDDVVKTVEGHQEHKIMPTAYRCLVQPMDFMLGIGDLSGEVMRRCVNSLGGGDFDACFQACNFLQSLYTGYMGLTQARNKEITHKVYTLRQSVMKVENVCYNIKVRGREAVKWTGDDPDDKHHDIDEGFSNY